MKANNKKITTALKKARSNLDKIIDMIEQDKYCIDVLQQTLAAIGLIKSANSKILKAHLESCFKDASLSEDKEEINEKIQELLYVIKLFQK